MNLLVTGGAGFIGSSYVRQVRRARPADKIVNVDALTYAGNLENLRDLESDAGHVFVRADIRDGAAMLELLRRHEIEAVVNFAAESHVDRSIMSAEPFVDTNVVGTLRLLEAARAAERAPFRAGLHRRGLRLARARPEPSRRRRRSRRAARTPRARPPPTTWWRRSTTPTGWTRVITRCSNNYGPYQFPEKLIPLMILNAFEGKPLPVYGDGLYVRDWIHVEDHCDADRSGADRGARRARSTTSAPRTSGPTWTSCEASCA